MLAQIINYWIKNYTAKENNRRREEEEFKEIQLHSKFMQVYEFERKPLYLKARALFNAKMKAGELHKKEIDYIEKLVVKSLGACIEEYKYYKFSNKAHRIYVLMKDPHIEPEEWKNIISFLEGID